mgnify:CR=1 FL=1
MRLIAILTNVALLVAVAVLVASSPPANRKDYLLVILFLVAPVCSLIALFTSGKSQSYFSLYWQRRALEEKQKIEDLRSRSKD